MKKNIAIVLIVLSFGAISSQAFADQEQPNCTVVNPDSVKVLDDASAGNKQPAAAAADARE